MKIVRITCDIAYEDRAEHAPKSRRSLEALLDKTLDPVLGDYTICSLGVLVQEVDIADVDQDPKAAAHQRWTEAALKQLALLDVERFVITRAVSEPVPAERVVAKSRSKK